MRCQALLVLFLLAITAAPVSAQGPSSGAAIYQRHCAGCHGPRGEGGRGPMLAVPTLVRASNEASVIEIIRLGIPGTEMGLTRMTDGEVRQVARYVLQLGRSTPPKVPGDASRGERLYATKGNCASCHAVKGNGAVFGPDLTDIGIRRGAGHLRRSLLEPEADIPDNFLQYRWFATFPENFLLVSATTRSGARIIGSRINEDTFSIQIRDMTGRLHSLEKSDLTELQKDWGKSPMPSYATTFTNSELDDLIAYLASLRGTR